MSVLKLIEQGYLDLNESMDRLLEEAFYAADRAHWRGEVSSQEYFVFHNEVPKPRGLVTHF